MQHSNKTERELPGLELPCHIKEEIEEAKKNFSARYSIDPELHQSAIDPSLPYPINWWDLMSHELYRQWQELEAAYYDRCTLLQMQWEREDYHNSPEAQRERAEQAAEEEQLEGYLKKVRAYSGKEALLEEDLLIPLIAGIEEFDIKIEVIRLSVKLGYICPLTEEELSPSTARRSEIESAHPAFIKYAAEITPDVSVDTATIIDWEYEEAMAYLAGYVPKGYYIGFESDFGWGVFRHGSFDGDFD